MIKIQPDNLKYILEKHTRETLEWVQPRVVFYKQFFSLIHQVSCSVPIRLTDINKLLYYDANIHYATINRLLNLCWKTPLYTKNISQEKLLEEVLPQVKQASKLIPFLWTKHYVLFEFFEKIEKLLEEIISAHPKRLKGLDNEIQDWVKRRIKPTGDDQKHILNFYKIIFDYEGKFNKKGSKHWNAYQLADALQVNVCPYCNEMYTITVIDESGKNVVKPDFDHFFSQKDHPTLRLSFYNLVSSCSLCNSRLKGEDEFSLEENLHPYFEGFDNDAKFSFLPKITSNSHVEPEMAIRLKLNHKHLDKNRIKKIEQNIEKFKLKERYLYHIDVAQELYEKRQHYSEGYLNILRKTYKGLNLSKKKAYRLAFGNFYDEKDFIKRPLAKFTRDIAEELGLI